MNTNSSDTRQTKRPWHLWLISILSIIWYSSGSYTILMAQAGKLANLSVDEAAYYAAQPLWFILLTDVSLFSAMIASVLLLFMHRFAYWLFALSLTTIVITNLFDLIQGTSRALDNTGAMVVTIIIVVIAILLLFYSWRMKNSEILK